MLKLGLGFGRNRSSWQNSIARSAISCILVLITQFSLLIVPRYFSSLPLTPQLFLSGVVLVFVAGVGKLCKRLLRVRASAPAFVFFTVLFVWAVYLAAVRPAISPLGDILLNGGLILLVIGFFSIMSSDPGFVKVASSNAENTMALDSSAIGLCSTQTSMERRVRFCKTCDAFVRGYDHHCPAFGNCIGQENHLLFIVLLGGFIAVEISYVISVHEVAINFQSLSDRENSLKESFAISAMLYSIIQVTWQVVFLAWHVYCICFNVKTDECVGAICSLLYSFLDGHIPPPHIYSDTQDLIVQRLSEVERNFSLSSEND
ncbi:hypothetical protein Droror1_Dr00004320 [Drosera rotundifolia]